MLVVDGKGQIFENRRKKADRREKEEQKEEEKRVGPRREDEIEKVEKDK